MEKTFFFGDTVFLIAFSKGVEQKIIEADRRRFREAFPDLLDEEMLGGLPRVPNTTPPYMSASHI